MSGTSSGGPGAEASLALVRDFLNTRNVELGADELDHPEALGRWLAERGLAPGEPVREEAWRDALALREALRSLALAHHDRATPEQPAVAEVNRVAASVRLRVAVADDGGVRLAPAAGDRAGLAGLLAAVLETALDGSWPRLKACADDTCQWAFVDSSKNRSRTWCSMEVCGSRAKARAYRERRRQPER